MIKYIWIAYIAWNLLVFLIYGYDKAKSKANAKNYKGGEGRVPEQTLIILAVLMGGFGAAAAMRSLRHKTKHTSFKLIVPVCAAVQLAAMFWFFRK